MDAGVEEVRAHPQAKAPATTFPNRSADWAAIVDELYCALLNRQADPAGRRHFAQRLKHGEPLSAIVRDIVRSPEFRDRCDTLLKVPPSVDHHFVIVTGEPVDKVMAVVRGIAGKMGPADRMTVLSGADGPPDRAEMPEGAQLQLRPGSSIFHLRQELPLICAGSRWVVLLEDHNVPGDGWFEALATASASAGDDDLALVGPFENRTSQGPWSWASFLTTFPRHWGPLAGHERPPPVIGNTAVRQTCLPQRRLSFGEFENTVLPSLAHGVRTVPDLAIDHVQHCGFLGASFAHFHNGRVAGALMRLTSAQVRPCVASYLRDCLRQRPRAIRRRVQSHPNRDAIPSRNTLRVRWLCGATALGYLCGTLFGAGRSPYALE